MRLCLEALTRPFIAKIGVAGMPDTDEAVGEMVDAGVRIIHANVGDVTAPRGQDVIRRLKRHGAFVIAGGGIRTAAEARAALGAGADAVAVATAAMDDAGLCERLQAELRGG